MLTLDIKLGDAIKTCNVSCAKWSEQIGHALKKISDGADDVESKLKKVSDLESKRAKLVRMKEMQKEDKGLTTDLSYHPDLVDILPPRKPSRIYTMHVAGVPSPMRERADFCLSFFSLPFLHYLKCKV